MTRPTITTSLGGTQTWHIHRVAPCKESEATFFTLSAVKLKRLHQASTSLGGTQTWHNHRVAPCKESEAIVWSAFQGFGRTLAEFCSLSFAANVWVESLVEFCFPQWDKQLRRLKPDFP